MFIFLKFIAILLLSETLAIQNAPYTDEDGRLVWIPNIILHGKHSNYKIIQMLGEGAFGAVVKVEIDKTGNKNQHEAIKIIDNDSDGVPVTQEDTILDAIASLNSKCLCKKKESFVDYKHKCIVFDEHGPNLLEILKQHSFEPFCLDHIRHILTQLCVDVQLLHEKNIVHKDIKLANILLVRSEYHPNSKNLKDTEVVLIDFGSAEFINEHSSKPEDEKKFDVQFIGNVALELLHYHTPFKIMIENKDIYEDNFNSALKLVAEKGVEYKELHDLLGKMLKFNPRDRITLTEVLRHPFLKGSKNNESDQKRKRDQSPTRDQKRIRE